MPPRGPCKSCGSLGRCRSDCEKRKAREALDVTPETKPAESTAIVPRSRKWDHNVDRLRGILERATDDQVIEILIIVAHVAKDRRDKIEEDHLARIAKFDAILPQPGKFDPARRAEPDDEPSFLDGVAARVASASRDVPTSAPSMRVASVQTPSHEVSPTPKGLQCPAINPSDVTVKCTQPRNHEGMHYNHATKTRWEKRT